MNNYLLLGACFLLGLLLRRSGRLPDNAATALNGFVVHISLPALTLTYVHGLDLDTGLILPALMAWIMFGMAAVYSSSHAVDAKAVIRKIALFAPFQAFVLALLLIPLEYPVWLDELLKRLGATLVPLALVSVGYQLRLSSVLGAEGHVMRVTVFEAAMAPMIGASIVAMEHDLDPPLVTLMIGVGIPLSFLTLPAWWYLLNFV